MGGAIAVGLIGFTLADKRSTSWSGEPIDLPKSKVVDFRLVLGGILFGVGWGIAGYCPGPGIVGGAQQALLGGQGLRNNAVRWLFLAGLVAAPWIWRLFAPLPVTRIDVGWLAVIAAGLLVGIGVRMGNGCTSGHGVCGLSRLSLRSLVNVLAFMGAGVVTVTPLRLVF